MKTLKVVLAVTFCTLSFIVLPRLFLPKVPPEFLVPFPPLRNVLTVLTVLGLTLAVLYTAKTLTLKRNPVNLVASVSLELAAFYVLLFFIGFGDPASFGRTEKAIPVAGPGATLMFDFRIFVLLLLVVLAVKVIVALLKFCQARSKPALGNITNSKARGG